MTQCGENFAVRTWTTVTMEKDVASLWKDFYNLQFAIGQRSSVREKGREGGSRVGERESVCKIRGSILGGAKVKFF